MRIALQANGITNFGRPIKLIAPHAAIARGIGLVHPQKVIMARDKGAAVRRISAALDESMSLSGRIAVRCQGRILETLAAATATREQLGLLMAGVTKEAVHG